jgi:DNA-binding NarL/FixJ family response regulator
VRLAIIAPTLALRAGLQALLGFPASPGVAESAAGVLVYAAASLEEFAAADIPADILLISGEALDETTLRRLLDKEQERLGILAIDDRPEVLSLLADLPLSGWCLLPRDASADELHLGLRAVTAGLATAPAALLAATVTRPVERANALLSTDLDHNGNRTLTDRESQVLQHLARGLANKQIALALSISEHTVKFHVSAIYAKLGASNRTEAVRAGVRRGLIIL